MNKKIIFILLLLVIPLVSAQIELSKPSYDQQETIQIEIFLENLVQDITLSNIKVTDLENNKQPIQLNLLKLKNNYYYLFFELSNPGQYVLKIENIHYKEQGILKQTSLMKNFEITTNKKDISVFPAAFKYEKGVPTFALKTKNNNQIAKTITLSSTFPNLEFPTAITIPGRTEITTNIKLTNLTQENITFKVEDYTIPIFILVTPEPEQPPLEPEPELEEIPEPEQPPLEPEPELEEIPEEKEEYKACGDGLCDFDESYETCPDDCIKPQEPAPEEQKPKTVLIISLILIVILIIIIFWFVRKPIKKRKFSEYIEKTTKKKKR